jgi:hypothetical protein
MPADDEAFAWNRLREASDKIGPTATKLVAYKNTAAGYALAAVHVASLRDANGQCRKRGSKLTRSVSRMSLSHAICPIFGETINSVVRKRESGPSGTHRQEGTIDFGETIDVPSHLMLDDARQIRGEGIGQKFCSALSSTNGVLRFTLRADIAILFSS